LKKQHEESTISFLVNSLRYKLCTKYENRPIEEFQAVCLDIYEFLATGDSEGMRLLKEKQKVSVPSK